MTTLKNRLDEDLTDFSKKDEKSIKTRFQRINHTHKPNLTCWSMHECYSKVATKKKTKKHTENNKTKSTHKSVLSRREGRRRPTFWKIR
jgi:hypothetical protein